MGLLLVLPWLVPLGAAAIVPWRRAWWVPALAALPGLAAALLLTDDARLELPWLLLGTSLGSDQVARLFLAFTSVLWLAAGIYAAPVMRDGPHAGRFRVFFLLAMAGNLWLILGQDLASFYLGFALMGLASYGLVVHEGDADALRAGRVYLAMALAGEMALFVALVMIARHTGTMTPEPAELTGLGNLAIGLLILGLAVKAGLVPLHVWLPLAHPAAPVPASAVLSGAMIKVALLGWLRFLPVGEEALVGWGLLLVFMGLISLLFAIPVGLVQANPKVILAYSSVSKMGLLSLTLGLLLLDPGLAPAGILALTLYAVHHGLTKGGLFLGVGLRLHAPLQGLILAGSSLLALTIAGLPPTSGAVAKFGIKPILAGTDWSWLTQVVAFSTAATTLLMARFLWVVWRLSPHPEPGYAAGTLAWGGLIALTVVYSLTLGTAQAWLTNALPVVIGLALSGAVALVARLKPGLLSPLVGRVPPGDLLRLAGPVLAVGRFTVEITRRQARRARRLLVSRAAAALTALRSRSGDAESAMGDWPTAGVAWLGILALLMALGFSAPRMDRSDEDASTRVGPSESLPQTSPRQEPEPEEPEPEEPEPEEPEPEEPEPEELVPEEPEPEVLVPEELVPEEAAPREPGVEQTAPGGDETVNQGPEGEAKEAPPEQIGLVGTCDPARPFELGHPEIATTLSLTDCRIGPAGPEPIPAPPLTNALVRLVQLHLRDRGFDPGPVDGLIGPRTRTALRAFAVDQGLIMGGEISFEILERLRSAGAEAPPTPGPIRGPAP